MGKHKEHPKHNIISIRVTDKELEALSVESKNSNRSISELMREALHKITPSSTNCYENYYKGGITA